MIDRPTLPRRRAFTERHRAGCLIGGLDADESELLLRSVLPVTYPLAEERPQMDMLIGRKLSQVVRLAWHSADGPDDLSVGPVHLVFDDGQGLLLDGKSDWALRLIETCPGNDRWLDAYDYDWDGWRWIARDATAEPPFASVVARPLTSLDPIRNEVNEVVGLRMNFDGQVVSLKTCQGEVRT